VDLKEQALPAIAKRHRVQVERRPASLLTVRTARDYLTALRYDHKRQRGEAVEQNAFSEDWQAEFSIVEENALVGAGARLFDSVVLSGASVAAGAVLVRSVVCPGGIVRPKQRIVDEVIAPGGMNGRGGAP
jgi:mannose-1-phosphate guanylyltransferase